MSNILPVPFRPQQTDGYCLPACAEMVLAYYAIKVKQSQLAHLFETDPSFGTPFSRVTRLSKMGVRVVAKTDGTWDELKQFLDAREPIITAVNLLFIPYIKVDSRHVVVLVGYNDRFAQILDPAQPGEVLAIDENAFIAAWTEMECAYAVIRK